MNKCANCGNSDVDNAGDLCELCALGHSHQSPKSHNHGTKRKIPIKNQDDSDEDKNYGKGNSRKVLINGTPQNIYSQGNTISQTTTPNQSMILTNPKPIKKVSIFSRQPISKGFVQNFHTSNERRSFWVKWYHSFFKSVPFSSDDSIHSFEVYPDYEGTYNDYGVLCDLILIYGRIRTRLHNNNEVEVFGKRNNDNAIIASKVVNKASNTEIRPEKAIPAIIIRLMTFAVFFFLFILILAGVAAARVASDPNVSSNFGSIVSKLFFSVALVAVGIVLRRINNSFLNNLSAICFVVALLIVLSVFMPSVYNFIIFVIIAVMAWPIIKGFLGNLFR